MWAGHSCLSPAPLLLPSALAHHPDLCQTTWDADGRYYPGFFCPRLIPRRKPTAATCRLQGAPAAPGLNLRPCTRSTCPPFRPHPSSGENSKPQSHWDTGKGFQHPEFCF